MRSEKWRRWGGVVENWGGAGIGRWMGELDVMRSVKFRCLAGRPRRLARYRVVSIEPKPRFNFLQSSIQSGHKCR